MCMVRELKNEHQLNLLMFRCIMHFQEYLQHFYNFEREPLTRTKRSDPSFSSKLADMQNFFGLELTGSLDAQTLEVIRTPRCGVSDVEDYSHGTLTRWKKNKVTFG